MKKRILFFALCAMTAIFTSCVEDDDHEPFSEVNDVEIEMSAEQAFHGDKGDSPPKGDD